MDSRHLGNVDSGFWSQSVICGQWTHLVSLVWSPHYCGHFCPALRCPHYWGSTVLIVGWQRTLKYNFNTSTSKMDFLSRISLFGSYGFEKVMLLWPDNVQFMCCHWGPMFLFWPKFRPIDFWIFPWKSSAMHMIFQINNFSKDKWLFDKVKPWKCVEIVLMYHHRIIFIKSVAGC